MTDHDQRLGATSVSLVEGLKSSDAETRSFALERFVNQYLDGMTHYLRACHGPLAAVELTNEFIAYGLERVAKNWDRDRPFRPYLKQCLRRLRQRAIAEPPAGEMHNVGDFSGYDDVDIGEIVGWLNRARELMRKRCEQKASYYSCIFYHLVEAVLWEGRKKPTYSQLGALCSLATESADKKVAGQVHRVRELFYDCVNEIIREYEDTDHKVESARLDIVALLSDTNIGLEIVGALQGKARDDSQPGKEVETLLGSFNSDLKMTDAGIAQTQLALNTILDSTVDASGKSVSVRTVIVRPANEAYCRETHASLKKQFVDAKFSGDASVEAATLIADMAIIASAWHNLRVWITTKHRSEIRKRLVELSLKDWLPTDVRDILTVAAESLRHES